MFSQLHSLHQKTSPKKELGSPTPKKLRVSQKRGKGQGGRADVGRLEGAAGEQDYDQVSFLVKAIKNLFLVLGTRSETLVRGMRKSSVEDPDPGSGTFFDPWIRDPGWVKSKDPDPGSGMNNPDHIS